MTTNARLRLGVCLAGAAALIVTACESRISPTSPSASSATVTSAVSATATSSASNAQDSRVDVCHGHGNGSYDLISVNGNALSAHLGHGDAQPGDPVPDVPGMRFDEACNQVDAVTCPCWDEAFLDRFIAPPVVCDSTDLPRQFILDSGDSIRWGLDTDRGTMRCFAKGEISIAPVLLRPAEADACLAQLQARCPIQ